MPIITHEIPKNQPEKFHTFVHETAGDEQTWIQAKHED